LLYGFDTVIYGFDTVKIKLNNKISCLLGPTADSSFEIRKSILFMEPNLSILNSDESGIRSSDSRFEILNNLTNRQII